METQRKRMEENGLSNDPLALFLFDNAVKQTEEHKKKYLESIYRE